MYNIHCIYQIRRIGKLVILPIFQFLLLTISLKSEVSYLTEKNLLDNFISLNYRESRNYYEESQ